MKKIHILVLISIFAVPLSSIVEIKGTDLWYVNYLALSIILNLGVSLALWKFNKWLSLFTMCCLLSAVTAARQHPRAMLCLFQVNLSALAIYAISKFNERQRIWVIRAIFGMFLIQGLWITLQIYNLDPIFAHIKNVAIDDTVGFSGSHNQIGLYFAATAPLVAYISAPFLALTVVGLWSSTTSFAWVGASCGIALYLTLIKKKLLIPFAIALVVASSIFFTRYENINKTIINERLNLWKHSILDVVRGSTIIRQELVPPTNEVDPNDQWGGKVFRPGTYQFMPLKVNRWLGFGIGNFIRVSPHTQWRFIKAPRPDLESVMHKYSHAHNDYVEVLYDMGFIGFIILIGFICSLFWRFCTAVKTPRMNMLFCCVIAHMVCALGIFTVHTAISGMLLVINLGLLEGEFRDGKIASVVQRKAIA